MTDKLIYNVTVKLTWAIHDEWIQWMKLNHIPQLMATNCFESYTFARLLEIEEDEGPTYTCQYLVKDKYFYETYINKYSTALRKASINKWGNQFIAFRTVMQVVD